MQRGNGTVNLRAIILAPGVALLLVVLIVLGLYGAPRQADAAVEAVSASYADAIINEDVTWSGTVLVSGSLVIATQTTLRIEPGTVVKFSASAESRQLPRLVILGRIQSSGSSERPVLLTGGGSTARSGWGGVLILSSEKRNLIEHTRIEGAETGLNVRFSSLTTKALAISKSHTGCQVRDSIVMMTASAISSCDTALESHDSELELKEGIISNNRRGLNLVRSSVVMSSVQLSRNSLSALVADDCRIKFTSCEVSDNTTGAQISGGEGQVLLCRFVRNRDTALQLVKARLKVSRTLISQNGRTGVRIEDDLPVLWGNAISDNGMYNLLYSGKDQLVATLNWWGSRDEASIAGRISSPAGLVAYYPWLSDKPSIFP